MNSLPSVSELSWEDYNLVSMLKNNDKTAFSEIIFNIGRGYVVLQIHKVGGFTSGKTKMGMLLVFKIIKSWWTKFPIRFVMQWE